MRWRERLPRRARVRSGREIRAVLRMGRRFRCGPVDAFLLPSPRNHPRVGVVVPRHGHTAVERNRLKRRLREIARRHWLPLARREGSASDLVLRASPEAYGSSFDSLRQALISGLVRHPAARDSQAADG
ncbi:MAG: ribonuclease P protein component [Gemmatimonadota bacterium]